VKTAAAKSDIFDPSNDSPLTLPLQAPSRPVVRAKSTSIPSLVDLSVIDHSNSGPKVAVSFAPSLRAGSTDVRELWLELVAAKPLRISQVVGIVRIVRTAKLRGRTGDSKVRLTLLNEDHDPVEHHFPRC